MSAQHHFASGTRPMRRVGPLTGDDLSLNQSLATLGYGGPS